MKPSERPLARLFDWFEAPDFGSFFEGMRPFEDRMRVEEEVVKDHLKIRLEMPGIDPAKDVEITVDDGMLSVRAERRKEEKTKVDGGFRSEFRYGSFRRTMALPKGVKGKDVAATYRDGILELDVPMPAKTEQVEKVAITRG